MLTLTLTGCFQSASGDDNIDMIESSGDDVEAPIERDNTLESTPTDLPAVATSEEVDEGQEDAEEQESTNAAEDAGPQIAVTASTPVPLFTDTPMPTDPPAANEEQGTTEDVPLAGSPPPTFVTPQVGGTSAVSTAPPDPTDTPTSGLEATPTDFTDQQPADDVPQECLVTVQRGDTVFRIAINNNTTVAAIVDANPGLNPDLIQPGDELVLPDCNASVQAPATAAPEVDIDDPVEIGDPGQVIHRVQSGETLNTIANRYGVTIADIVGANDLTNPDRLSIGQELVIPVD